MHTAQTKPCIFCEIAAGKAQQSQVIYKDNSVIVFLDRAPENMGHMLVVPINHARYFTDIPDSTVCNMMAVAKRMIAAIKKTDIPAEAFRLMMNSGEAAGQSVKHAHLHIMPRYKGEILNTEKKIASTEELEAVAIKIRKALL